MKRYVMLAAVLLLGASQAYAEEEMMEKDKLAKAIFAGGCFWCMEKPFESMKGVHSVISGYSGGHVDNPTYREVSSGRSGHYEVVEVTYDPALVSYAQLVEEFWVNIDPHDDGGQFCDRGPQYKAGIFVKSEEERSIAQTSKDALNASGKLKSEVVTEILDADVFYEAEGYHQDYYLKNPIRYGFYRSNCGRDKRLKAVWGKAAKH